LVIWGTIRHIVLKTMQNIYSNWPPLLKKIWWLILALVLAGSISVTMVIKGQQSSVAANLDPSPEINLAVAAPIPPIDKNTKQVGVLLAGYGGPGHSGGMLADVIQVLWIDMEKSQVALISIPRDLWVNTNGQGTKINAGLANSSGLAEGMDTMKQLASIVTGLPISYAVAIDFVGLQRLVGETLKGIEVSVTSRLDDPWYPITGEELNTCGLTSEEVASLSAQFSGFELEKQFPCRYEHLSFEPGKIKMEGGEALKYVRSRHGSSDFDRSRRQQEVLLAMKNRIVSLGMLDDLAKFFESLQRTISTDFDLQTLELLLPVFNSFQDTTPVSIVLSTDNVFSSGRSSSGQSILQPKSGSWQEVHQFIQDKLAN